MSSPDFRLDGRIAVLTGSAGILGRRMARALLDQGAHVALIDRSPEALETLRTGLSAEQAPRALLIEADITDRAALEGARQEIEQKMGPVDVLVNNAATKSEHFFEPFESFPLDDWHAVMNVNLTGVMLGCQVFGSSMAARQRGSVINTLSIYGIAAPDQRIYEGSLYEGRPINTPAVYSASKAAVWGLTQYLASYWGHRGVRVNALTPGGVFSGQNDVFVSCYSARVPLGRMADQDEMCGALVYLASDASSYVTGHNLVVDGGLTVW